ncbi:diaminopimelate epimerase [Plantactinospora sp. GCM10030261]|uniref:diaminopimelate epimerase n=1 Tax=Plantactinospora sp. GCM10030261 TaxID=3273420 RepID=UPI00361D8453
MEFTKGHGTGNDFVILPDPEGRLALTPALVAALCDRRRGVGGDGVLRVVRSAKHPDAVGDAAEAEWFMDYWNADGSHAEMCGNGARVFVRYLLDNGLVPVGEATVPVATRAGVVRAVIADGTIAVGMRLPRMYARSTAETGGLTLPGRVVDVGNPHLVCPLPAGVDLAALDLTRAPGYDPAMFPAGVNVEFTAPGEPDGSGFGDPVAATSGDPAGSGDSAGSGNSGGTTDSGGSAGSAVGRADVHIRMRVYERGSAETQSCGTGACAVAAVALAEAGRDAGLVAVDVPGGRLTVALDGSACWLAGPAVLVAHGRVDTTALPHT